MKANPKKLMHMICYGEKILIACCSIPVGHPAAAVEGCYDDPDCDAECVPMTEAAFADYCRRHERCKPLYSSLAAYPAPRG